MFVINILVIYLIRFKYLLLLVLIFFLVSLTFYCGAGISLTILICLLSSGLLLSLFININKSDHRLFSRICISKVQKYCGALFTTKEGLLLNNLSLIYFTSTVIFEILAVITYGNEYILATVLLMTLLSIPIIVYALYLQIYLYRQICILCLTIIVIVVSITVLCMPYYHSIQNITLDIAVLILTCVGFIAALRYYMIKSEIHLSSACKNSRELNNWKRNPSFWKRLLESAPIVEPQRLKYEIEAGKEKGLRTVIFILSIHCMPCLRLAEWLRYFLVVSGDTLVKLRFASGQDDEEAKRVIYVLWKTYDRFGIDFTLEKLIAIMKNRGLNKKGKVDKCNCFGDKDDILDKTTEHIEWSKNCGIQYTPAVIYNDRLLPNDLSLDDIGYLIRQGYH
ncbi:MAG TPA: disulfide bond formation protein B [Saprospiraceae bacterium]|nr:disulfide bond formation protein B [Saprospiraceae bacterium]